MTEIVKFCFILSIYMYRYTYLVKNYNIIIIKITFPCILFQGKLIGSEFDHTELPSVAIVTHYDSFGLAPVSMQVM